MYLTLQATQENLETMYVPELPFTDEYITFDASMIASLSPDKLLELLCNESRTLNHKDPDLLIDALMTLGHWMSPSVCLLNILSRYVGPQAESEQRAEWERESKLIRGGVIKVLFEWINNPLMGQDFFKTVGMKEVLLSFSQTHGVSLRALNMNAKDHVVGGRARSQSLISYESKGTRSRREESVFELPVKNVAEQLTLIEFGFLADISLSELCGQAWNKTGKEEKAKNVLNYISWFNRFSRWMVAQIINQSQALERAAAISKFVEIGQALYSMNNFNGAIEVLSALHSSPIRRLKGTWALVPKDVMATLEDLGQLMNTEGNFRFYRGLLEKSKPPLVPYLGLLLTDLTFLDDANLSVVGKNKLLSMEKIKMMAGVHKTFRRCLTKTYAFVEMRSVRKLLLKIEDYDENELYRLSKLRESGNSSGEGHSGGDRGGNDLKKGRKNISQITSSMLTRTKLNIADDTLSKKDWEKLLSLDGVTVETIQQEGQEVYREGQLLECLYRVKTGTLGLRKKRFGEAELAEFQVGNVCGVLSVLNPGKSSSVSAVTQNSTCEVYRIPPRVIHQFCEDLELSRRFYGYLAQFQVEHITSINDRTLSMIRRSSKEAIETEMERRLGSWDISWTTKNADGKDFNFLGVLVLTVKSVTLSSKMLGFLTEEKMHLARVTECVMEGAMGCILGTDREGNRIRQTFKSLTGSADTEKAVAQIEEARLSDNLKKDKHDSVGRENASASKIKDPMALTNEDWEALTEGAKKIIVKKDEVVIQEGESYQRMYQLRRGSIRVEKTIGGEVQVLGRLGASETFGEMSFLTGSAATATCVADSDECELTVMEGFYVNMLMSIRPEIAGRFYKFLALLITARIEAKFS
jgi:CRP-like cAMP-binding protein